MSTDHVVEPHDESPIVCGTKREHSSRGNRYEDRRNEPRRGQPMVNGDGVRRTISVPRPYIMNTHGRNKGPLIYQNTLDERHHCATRNEYSQTISSQPSVEPYD